MAGDRGTGVHAMARWWEWEAASDGRRQLTWSTGRRDLRVLAWLGREATDEEVAAEDADADERIAIPREAWSAIVAARQEAALLASAEHEGLNGARAWLGSRRLAWFVAAPGDGLGARGGGGSELAQQPSTCARNPVTRRKMLNRLPGPAGPATTG